ncbi:MAG TPA: hypothetical protein VL361_09575 [Candidatus Limnocylindrales bacterium]|jgi:hypothetical protein|nr:hypothetical protein [Candidatus Limnocylindrales bacterium]
MCSSSLDGGESLTKPDLSQYPSSSISTKQLKATFYLPDPQKGYYRGTRFDWSGLLSRVEYGGHSFFCEFRERQHDPLNHDDICGTAEEFGMTTTPLGFAEGKTGEPFVKIGIGVLERGNDPEYAFWKKYKILQPGNWNIQTKPDSIEFTQGLNTTQGWSYEYTKRVRLDDTAHTLTITRRLKNTGTKKIDTDHYGHNFLKIDDVPAGPDYVFEFPFQPHFGEGSKPEGCVEIKDKSLVFLKQVPTGKSIWVRLDGFTKPSDNQMRIVNRRTGAAMTIRTDKPLLRLVYYSSDGVLAPEPFVKLELAPGETTEWRTTYEFEAGKQ